MYLWKENFGEVKENIEIIRRISLEIRGIFLEKLFSKNLKIFGINVQNSQAENSWKFQEFFEQP